MPFRTKGSSSQECKLWLRWPLKCWKKKATNNHKEQRHIGRHPVFPINVNCAYQTVNGHFLPNVSKNDSVPKAQNDSMAIRSSKENWRIMSGLLLTHLWSKSTQIIPNSMEWGEPPQTREFKVKTKSLPGLW